MEDFAVPAPSRWLRLAGYSLLAASTQLLWLTYAPVTTESARVLHTSVANVGNLAVVFPLLYVILGIPAGRLLDLRFRRALLLGAALTGAGALVRVAAPFNFSVQLVGQTVIALGQPFVLNAITKMAELYFPPRERPTAIAIGSASLFIGILAAMGLSGPLWQAGGLSFLLIVEAIPAVAGALWVAAALAVPGDAGRQGKITAVERFRPDRLVWQLSGLLFIGMGIFNALSTWLEPILNHFGEASASGNLLAEMALAGIIGAAVFPAQVACARRSRTFLSIVLLVTIATLSAIAAYHREAWLYVWMGIEGLGLLSALPVLLSWVERHVAAGQQASAVGLVMLAGNLGGVVLVLADETVIGNPYLALGVIALAAAAGLGLALTLKADPAPGGSANISL
ncbi:MAG TPA: MFS transporter [Spirochaetia bacterium]|nr:MFS transporter [Spirochaetia bacterium]